MMLQFFVLGLIPGTHLQITFSWFLVLGIVADIVFGTFYVYTIMRANRPKSAKNLVSADSKKLATSN